MKNLFEKIEEFNNAFGVEVEHDENHLISTYQTILRFKLMGEENQEYSDACKWDNTVEIADALGDMLYILCGTIKSHGLENKIVPMFEEIHRSNMSKLDANGKPIYREDGKVLKGPNYFKPNIEKILNE